MWWVFIQSQKVMLWFEGFVAKCFFATVFRISEGGFRLMELPLLLQHNVCVFVCLCVCVYDFWLLLMLLLLLLFTLWLLLLLLLYFTTFL